MFDRIDSVLARLLEIPPKVAIGAFLAFLPIWLGLENHHRLTLLALALALSTAVGAWWLVRRRTERLADRERLDALPAEERQMELVERGRLREIGRLQADLRLQHRALADADTLPNMEPAGRAEMRARAAGRIAVIHSKLRQLGA